MSFHEGSWSARYTVMGDTAEAVFEAVHDRGFARWGLHRPPISVAKLPAVIRMAPDYVTSVGFMEVQGFGTDGIVRVKQEKLDACAWWHAIWPVTFFLWDSKKRRFGYLPLGELEAATVRADSDVYPDSHKLYYLVPADSLDVDWRSYAP